MVSPMGSSKSSVAGAASRVVEVLDSTWGGALDLLGYRSNISGCHVCVVCMCDPGNLIRIMEHECLSFRLCVCVIQVASSELWNMSVSPLGCVYV